MLEVAMILKSPTAFPFPPPTKTIWERDVPATVRSALASIAVGVEVPIPTLPVLVTVRKDDAVEPSDAVDEATVKSDESVLP